MNKQTKDSSKRLICLFTLAYWVVMSTLCCLLYPCTISDTMSRYAPMADAFARGDWYYAFHPRFGILFMVVSGTLRWCLGVDGGMACQIGAFLLLALSAVPVWHAFRKLFDERTAWVVVVMVLSAVEYYLYALDGTRDTGRILGMAICLVAVVENRSLLMALGLLALVTLRTDLFVITAVMLFGWCVWQVWRRAWKAIVLPVVSWCLGVALMSLMTFAYTGYFLPGAQFVRIWVKIFGGVQ